jgi:hypothetical protein
MIRVQLIWNCRLDLGAMITDMKKQGKGLYVTAADGRRYRICLIWPFALAVRVPRAVA